MTLKKWDLIFTDKANKKFKKLPQDIQKRIISFFDERILVSEDPASYARALTGDLQGLWRFRVGDYRIVANILQGEMVIVSVDIGHRKEIYNLH